uniref:Uncharacterized protein n=1 Tax=Schistocephalus solidus TaxID=70667 RepID=A0A0X3P2T1_SCHSO
MKISGGSGCRWPGRSKPPLNLPPRLAQILWSGSVIRVTLRARQPLQTNKQGPRYPLSWQPSRPWLSMHREYLQVRQVVYNDKNALSRRPCSLLLFSCLGFCPSQSLDWLATRVHTAVVIEDPCWQHRFTKLHCGLPKNYHP